MAVFASDLQDVRRRSLLEESDRLLDALEELRLADQTRVPASLKRAVTTLQARLGRRDPPLPPATLRAAHSMVFAVQSRLMAANPRNPRGRAHPGRAQGAPRIEALRQGARWKMLTLPALPPGGGDEGWLELVEATVERALERWAYAQHQAAQAARERHGVGCGLAMAQAAWANYYELSLEGERILGRAAGGWAQTPVSRRSRGQRREEPAARSL